MNKQDYNSPVLPKDNIASTNLNMSQNGFFTNKFNREPREDATKHEFEKFPYGSYKRLFAAFKELTGIDILKMEET
jgi:hypothetical protein